MTDQKILFVHSYSKTIYDMNALTMNNHVRYFNRHGYSFIYKDEQYHDGLFDFKSVKKYLEEYDIVVTLGIDCIITNFDIPITDYMSNYVTVAQESAFSKRCGVYANGEIMIFNKKDNLLLQLLDLFQLAQYIERATFKSIRLRHMTAEPFYSTQTFFNNVYFNRYRHSVLFRPYINYAGIGTLQSYINKYSAITVTPDEEWRPGRFLLHVFGKPNGDKIKYITEFLNEHPEYK